MSRRTRTLAVLFAAMVVASGCAGWLPKASPQSAADVALANRVYLALNADPVYFYRHVDVRVDDGVADLSGYVWTSEAMYHARQIARGVPGITRVVNQLELEREGRGNGVSSR